MIFHEASHAIGEPVIALAIAHEEQRQHRVVPSILWHAILFFAAGEIARRHIGGYTPYAYANHLWERYPEGIEPLLRAHLMRWIAGEQSIDDAIAALVGAIDPPR